MIASSPGEAGRGISPRDPSVDLSIQASPAPLEHPITGESMVKRKR
jgi:hypothetical protein